MSEEEIKRIANEEILNTIKTELNSSMIFTYINNLEQENKQLKSILTELEEYLYNEIDYFSEDINVCLRNEAISVLNKLKELKEKYK